MWWESYVGCAGDATGAAGSIRVRFGPFGIRFQAHHLSNHAFYRSSRILQTSTESQIARSSQPKKCLFASYAATIPSLRHWRAEIALRDRRAAILGLINRRAVNPLAWDASPRSARGPPAQSSRGATMPVPSATTITANVAPRPHRF